MVPNPAIPASPSASGSSSALHPGTGPAVPRPRWPGLRSLSAPLRDGSVPASPASTLPRLPASLGGGATGSGAAGGAVGGGSGGGLQAGLSARLITQRTLVLLRLARRATAKSIWRSYLPEVPPA